jgi:flagellar protein FliS
VFELRSTLRLDAWDGAHGLHDLYVFIEERLMQANLRKDAAMVADCRKLIEPLRDAFKEAAGMATPAQPPLAVATA